MLWNLNECGKKKVIKISRKSSLLRSLLRSETSKGCGIFKYLANLITNDGRCRRGLVTSYVGTALYKRVIKGKVERSTGLTGRRVRRRKHRTDDLKGRREYGKLKEKHKIALYGELAVDLS
jgi:hypothetical protein